jgi:hypothetical protein
MNVMALPRSRAHEKQYPVVPGRGRDGPGESGYVVHGGTGNDHPRVAPRPC